MASILATRGDYVSDASKKVTCLLQAYARAEPTHDITNMIEIAHSLSATYIEDHRDTIQGRAWLDRLEVLSRFSAEKDLSYARWIAPFLRLAKSSFRMSILTDHERLAREGHELC